MLESVVIVGASLAGMHAAHTLRTEGFTGRLAVVDADRHTPYDKPPLSKQVLKGDWEPDRIVLAAAKEDLGIHWHLGRRAVSLETAGREVILDDDTRLAYDGLVIATGAAARSLPAAPALDGIHLLRTLDDCIALRGDLDKGPSRVVVIGAGFIGSEVAATCRERDLEVTIVEVAEVPLERALGSVIGQVCGALHVEHGVDVRLGTGVDAIEGGTRVEHVRLTDGTTVDAEVVVVGIGVSPNTGWLHDSGLTIDNGVVTDATLSAAPGIVAAGDIARWPSARYGELLRIEHWENAIQMGEAAARRLLVPEGGDDVGDIYDPVPWFWSDQYDRKIQLAGRSGNEHELEIVHGSLDEFRFVALYGRDGRLDGVLGMNRPRHVMQLRELVTERAPWDEAVARARGL